MGDGGWKGLLSVYSFNQPLWRYGRSSLVGGSGIVGEKGSPLASCFLHSLFLSVARRFLLLLLVWILGRVGISHGDAENMNEFKSRSCYWKQWSSISISICWLGSSF